MLALHVYHAQEHLLRQCTAFGEKHCHNNYMEAAYFKRSTELPGHYWIASCEWQEAAYTMYMAATHPQLLLHFYRHDVDSSFV